MLLFSSIANLQSRIFVSKLLQFSTMATSKIAAVGQMRATNDKKHNLAQVEDIIKRSKSLNASFVFLPECCDFVGTNRSETLDLSEPLTGDLVKAYKKLAKENNLWLSLGGIHESILESDNKTKSNKIFNTHIVIDDQGELVGKYQKLHMFDVDTPEFKFRESDVVERGRQVGVPIQTPLGKLGLQICYDMRFPEASLILRKCGAELLTYPSAFAYSTGKAHWEILLRARAIENQCFVIAGAQIGFHNAKRQSWGHAMIVSPWGKILAECDPDKDLDVQVAEIDLTQMETVRKNMPCFSHRRSDVYSLYPIQVNEQRAKGVPEVYEFGDHVIPNETIFYQTKHSFAFTNIRCVVPGHVLVATRRNTPRLHDLTDNEVTDFFQTVCLVQKVTEKIYNSTSSTVTVQDGIDAGQTVKHVHCHVMPRKPGDFEHNDNIYVELNRHDHDTTEERRPLEEMVREADIFRKYF